MITVRCLRRLLSASSSLRFTSQLSQYGDQPLTPSKVLPVPKLEQTEKKGEHYKTSYRQFTSWLNSGGHAEVYEGCLVVGKVAQVFEGTIAVDWGHKHLGYAHVHPGSSHVIPEKSSYVICRLKAFENVALIMGHDQYDRHNEAVLEYIKAVPFESVNYSIPERPVIPESSPQGTELHQVDTNEALISSQAEVDTSEPSDSLWRDKSDDKPMFNIRDVPDKEENAPKFEKSSQRDERGNSNNRNNYQSNRSGNAENRNKNNYNHGNRDGNAENRKLNSNNNRSRRFNSNEQNNRGKPRGPRDNYRR